MIEKVWVIGIDYGVEGLGGPEMAFLTEEAAEAAAKLVQGKDHIQTCYVIEVPVWKHDQDTGILESKKDPAPMKEPGQ